MKARGLESGTVRVLGYDSAWPDIYAAEAARLRQSLDACGVTLVIEHMGSTAVPGLAAKPVIDILGGRRPYDDRLRIIGGVVAAGYVYRGEQGIVGRDFFRRGEPRQFHLHVAAIESDFCSNQRAFRDYLQLHVAAAAEYAVLKRDLAARFPRDREAYIAGKSDFIQMILARVERERTMHGV